jgi:hypothetical protein
MINDGIIMLQDAAPNPKLFPKLQRMKVRVLGMLALKEHCWEAGMKFSPCLIAL